jgi:hypothetical protein
VGAADFVANWGSTAAERAREYDCDRLVPDADLILYRAVSVRATAAVTFRWLCQLTRAPYSYDLIDNFGHRSPRELTPGADRLRVGQRVMRYFTLASFSRDEHLTLELRKSRLFGDLAITYRTEPAAAGTCRLVAKIALRKPPRVAGLICATVLPAGDLVMMRRQLLTLKRHAESTTPSEENTTA